MSNLEVGLFVFMLATFVGLEVIRKVITAQTTELADKETAVSILGTRMADTVLLIDALGGVGTRPSCRRRGHEPGRTGW